MARSVAVQSVAHLHREPNSVHHLHRQQSRAFVPASFASAKCQICCAPSGTQRNVASPGKACSSLALRAGVLRRAVSSSGAAQKRSAGCPLFHQPGAAGQQAFWLQQALRALPSLRARCSIGSRHLTAKNCRLTIRSTGPIAACGQRPAISFWAFSHIPQRSG